MGTCSSSSSPPPEAKENLLRSRRIKELRIVAKFEAEEKFVASSYNTTTTRFAIISSRWITQWLLFAISNGPPPPPISNHTLVNFIKQNESKIEMGFIKREIRVESDYRRISDLCYEFLSKTYGGGPKICVESHAGTSITDYEDTSRWQIDQRYFLRNLENIKLCQRKEISTPESPESSVADCFSSDTTTAVDEDDLNESVTDILCIDSSTLLALRKRAPTLAIQ